MTEHFDDEKDEIIDGDITEKNDDHEDDSDYEKFCFLCHRPESQAGKMIELPNNIHICNDCMQKSFDTMTQQMNNGLNLNDLLNMPNVSMINLGSIQDAIPRPKKVKKKKEDIVLFSYLKSYSCGFANVKASGFTTCKTIFLLFLYLPFTFTASFSNFFLFSEK